MEESETLRSNPDLSMSINLNVQMINMKHYVSYELFWMSGQTSQIWKISWPYVALLKVNIYQGR